MALRNAILLSAALAMPALAEDLGAPARNPAELDQIQKEIADAERQREEDTAYRAQLSEELQTLQSEAAASAAAIQTLERDLSRAERRIVELGGRDKELSDSLQARRGRISPLLGALQRLRRNPPPALAVSPDDAVAAARGAMLIAQVAKKLEQEAASLAQELIVLGQTRAALAAERDNVVSRTQELTSRRSELAGLIARRQMAIGELDEGVAAAAERIAGLQARTTDMADLMAWVEKETAMDAGRPAAEAASGPVTVASRGVHDSFAAARGHISWPAAGVVAGRFGEPDASGAPAEGVTLRTRGEAQVTAPSDGEIVFAGPFAGYGRLLILAPGEDYFVLIGGFGRLDAVVGQHVLAGEPLGSIAAPGAGGEALMYIELRRKGAPVDPLPWFEPIEASG